MPFLGHVSTGGTSKGRHRSGVMQAHITLGFPLEGLCIECIIVPCQIVKVHIRETGTSRSRLSFPRSHLLDCRDGASLLLSIYYIQFSQTGRTVIYEELHSYPRCEQALICHFAHFEQDSKLHNYNCLLNYLFALSEPG